MRKVKLGLALVAALVFGVAMTASASASSFLSTLTKAKLLSEKVENQVFTTEEGTVECSEAKTVKGETGTAGVEEPSQLAEIKYENCLAFGFVPTTLTNADYTFLATGGKSDLNNLIKIVSSNGVGGTCEVSVAAKQNLSSVKYTNSGKNIKIEPSITGIKYTASSGCSRPGTFTTGTYKGNTEAMISGGTLSFMP